MTTTAPDLSDLLSYYGVQVGRKMVTCPVHYDTQPSCSVNYQEGLWNCFSCGAAGDAWSLIMLKEELDFAGAREWAETHLGFDGEDVEQRRREVSFGTFSRRGGVASRKGDRPSRRKYVPSWRSS